MARSPLFGLLRRLHRLSMVSNQPGGPPVDEVVDIAASPSVSRRGFVVGSLAALGAVGAGGVGYYLSRESKPNPGRPSVRNDLKVAVVGAGLAGLTAAYTLKKAGIQATVYEASNRLGGRVFSRQNLLGEGLTTEVGGEFINTNHQDVLRLTKELGLELLDRKKFTNPKHKKTAYFFGGVERSELELARAFLPVSRRISEDVARFKKSQERMSQEFDKLTVADYFQKIEMDSWLRDLLNLTFTTDMGLDAGEQSALYVMYLEPKMKGDKAELLGDSDERYKIKGGNQQIATKLAEQLKGQIKTGEQLLNLRPLGDGFQLYFKSSVVNVDAVVLAIPFSVLRHIDLKIKLPDTLERFIRTVGYGTNAKVMAGFQKRVWKARGFGGEFYSDEGFQLAWDNTMLQATDSGGLTCFLGGKAGMDSGRETPQSQWEKLSPGLGKILPELNPQSNGKFARFHWPTHPFSQGSYACYKPGQYTQFVNKHVYEESNGVGNSVNVKNLFFAGEHLSDEYGGYMNGGVQTGRLAAQALLKRLGVKASG